MWMTLRPVHVKDSVKRTWEIWSTWKSFLHAEVQDRTFPKQDKDKIIKSKFQ